jgi:hypothetical protein
MSTDIISTQHEHDQLHDHHTDNDIPPDSIVHKHDHIGVINKTNKDSTDKYDSQLTKQFQTPPFSSRICNNSLSISPSLPSGDETISESDSDEQLQIDDSDEDQDDDNSVRQVKKNKNCTSNYHPLRT